MTNISSVGGFAVQPPPNPSGFSPPPPSDSVGSAQTSAALSAAPAAPEGGSAKSTAAAKPSAQELQDTVSSMQRKIASISPELQFSIDQTSGRSVVTLTDETTKNVIWQFPSEAATEISKALDVFQKGALIHRRA